MNDYDLTPDDCGEALEHSQSLWDAKKLGRVLRGARITNGYDRMSDLTRDLARVMGVRRHENTLYDIENGKRLPDMELMTALVLHLDVDFRKIAEAVCPEFREQWLEHYDR